MLPQSAVAAEGDLLEGVKTRKRQLAFGDASPKAPCEGTKGRLVLH